jgi:hypothetical protein
VKTTTASNTKETQMTTTPYMTYKRTAWYHEGHNMVIEASDETGRGLGWIRAVYHYKTNCLANLTVRLLTTGETGDVKVSHNDGRAAVRAAKTMLEEMLKKSAAAG